MSWTLGAYVARRFVASALFAFLAVFALVVLVDTVERLNQNEGGEASFPELVGLAFLHAPSITLAAAPFTVLLAAMACFARLARSSELTAARAAGVSVWGLLAPPVLAAALLGCASFAVYQPVAAAFKDRFDALERSLYGRSSSSLTVSAEGLWLRQGEGSRQTVIRADRASSTLERLWDVTVFRFGAEDRLAGRIEARTAVLEDGAWRLNVVRHWRFDPGARASVDPPAERGGDLRPGAAARETVAEERAEMRIETDLTPERILESFAPPDTLSFWELPDFVATLEQSGFAAARHRLHFQRMLAYPALFCAMVLVGAAFSMRPARFGGLGAMALGCVMTGFGYFFLSDLAAALGASGSIPVTVAAWAPPASAVLFALGLLLHVEDG